jgi:hypothetical protein
MKSFSRQLSKTQSIISISITTTTPQQPPPNYLSPPNAAV